MKLLRNKLVWVALICAAPLVLGTAAYLLGWSPGALSNYGELLDPKPVSGFESLRGKWVLVTFDAAACDAYCERKLYFMRQVRRAQGKDMDRVERLWVLTDGAKPRAELLAAIEGTRMQNLKPFDARSADHIYLVDPMGNLMLRFPRDPDPSKMIKDLQRLLKYSPRPK
ncbi:MAG TPA: cytochrome C oxidase subunit I [Burkholderiales bacterium]|nr:cytochrome C oxidase subunit I [Burkholderiales bacterium]